MIVHNLNIKGINRLRYILNVQWNYNAAIGLNRSLTQGHSTSAVATCFAGRSTANRRKNNRSD